MYFEVGNLKSMSRGIEGYLECRCWRLESSPPEFGSSTAATEVWTELPAKPPTSCVIEGQGRTPGEVGKRSAPFGAERSGSPPSPAVRGVAGGKLPPGPLTFGDGDF